jgi:hypothetical protein
VEDVDAVRHLADAYDARPRELAAEPPLGPHRHEHHRAEHEVQGAERPDDVLGPPRLEVRQAERAHEARDRAGGGPSVLRREVRGEEDEDHGEGNAQKAPRARDGPRVVEDERGARGERVDLGKRQNEVGEATVVGKLGVAVGPALDDEPRDWREYEEQHDRAAERVARERVHGEGPEEVELLLDRERPQVTVRLPEVAAV